MASQDSRSFSPHGTSQSIALSFGPLAGAGIYWPRSGGHTTGLWFGAFGNVAVALSNHWAVGPEMLFYEVVSREVPVSGTVAQVGFAVARSFE